MTLKATDSLSYAPEWSFGGGTALVVDLGHRISYDIDAFLDSPASIKDLVPTVNEVTRSICWNEETGRADYLWPGNYLKLMIRGLGEIDFLATASLVDDPVKPFDYEGRNIMRERPAEIIAKKILYRGAQFKPRDVFDLAATFTIMPDELRRLAGCVHLNDEVFDRVRARIEMCADRLTTSMVEEVNATDKGASMMSSAVETAIEALDVVHAVRRAPPGPSRNDQEPGR